jgi:flagellar FliJ protein
MKKFSFRLQTVLELRERVKEQTEMELAQLNFRLQRLNEEKNHLLLEKEEMLDRQARSQQGRIDVEEIFWFQGYALRLDEQVFRLSEEMWKVEQAKEGKRRELILATQECEVLLKLKERDFKKFLKEIDRAENQLIDELATIRFSRQKKKL